MASLDNKPIILGLSGVVQRNNEIGTIRFWGPAFRVSFDLKINSHVSGTESGWASVLSFKGNGGRIKGRNLEARIPTMFLNNKGSLHFTNPGQKKMALQMTLNKWYSVVVEQRAVAGKVRKQKENNP